jgi:hypothetical protein
MNTADSDPEDDVGEDSEIDEHFEICELEKRDFDDEEGIEQDLESINFRQGRSR